MKKRTGLRMKKYVVTMLLAFLCVFVMKPMMTQAATPNFEELKITEVGDDLRNYDAKVGLSAYYEWGKDGATVNSNNKYTEEKYGKFTLTKDSLVRIKITDTNDKIFMKNWFRVYGNDSMAVPLLDTDMGSLEDHYIKLDAGTYYTACGYEYDNLYQRNTKIMIGAIPLDKAIEVTQTVDTKNKTITLTATQKFANPCWGKAKWYAGKVSSMPWDAESVSVVDNTVVIKLDSKAKGWYTIEFQSDTTGYCDADAYCQAHIYVEGIKKAATKGKTYTKSNVKYKVTKNNSSNATGTVTVMGMKSHKSSVIIPKTVKINDYTYTITKVNSKAFYKKSKLRKVTIKAIGITSIGKKAFSGINKKAKIYVPKSKYSSYSKKLKAAGVKKPMQIKKK